MGVPSFYRITKNVAEEEEDTNPEEANPETDYDNLYLDMNGIIHTRSHPEGGAPLTLEDMKQGIFEEIERLFNAVKPKRLLYMAIDGVAPRAKTNQQRMRRFLSARQRVLQQEAYELWQEEHPGEPGGPAAVSAFDSNCITPGTEFMREVGVWLREWIDAKRKRSQAWKDIHIVLSDSSTPGEGEHKIIDFIRSQRLQPDYNANLKHVIYGLDADLIMLSLATHEVDISVLREKVFQGACDVCLLPGHIARDCPLLYISDEAEKDRLRQEMQSQPIPLEFCEIFSLRLYLRYEFCRKGTRLGNSDVPLDRLIDDFVFLTFFVGNDFLPHLLSLVIREGAFELLFSIYEPIVIDHGHLVDGNRINAQPLVELLRVLGEKEDKILKKRALKDAKIRERERKEALKRPERLSDEDLQIILDREHKIEEDPIREGTTGWQDRYYEVNLNISQKLPTEEKQERIRTLCAQYVEGLAWVLKYYVSGVPCWQWFYPHHYAPLAQDLGTIGDYLEAINLAGDFPPDQPFSPLEQLMAVLPPQSKSFLPQPYASLMVTQSSPLLDYYPNTNDYEVDMRGKRYEWQGIPRLPFIDSTLLRAALEGVPITPEETLRNTFSPPEIFLSTKVPVPGETLSFATHGITGTITSLDRNLVYAYSRPEIPSTYTAVTLPEARDKIGYLTEYAMASDLERNLATYVHAGLGVTHSVIVDYTSPALYPEVPPTSIGYRILEKMGWKGGPLGRHSYTERRLTPLSTPVQSGGLSFDKDKTAIRAEQEKEKAGGQSEGFTVDSFVTKAQIQKILQEIKDSCPPGGHKTVALPPGLNPKQRALVHTLCTEMGLKSSSVGLKNERQVLVSYGQAPRPLNQIDLTQAGAVAEFIRGKYAKSFEGERSTASLPLDHSEWKASQSPLSIVNELMQVVGGQAKAMGGRVTLIDCPLATPAEGFPMGNGTKQQAALDLLWWLVRQSESAPPKDTESSETETQQSPPASPPLAEGDSAAPLPPSPTPPPSTSSTPPPTSTPTIPPITPSVVIPTKALPSSVSPSVKATDSTPVESSTSSDASAATNQSNPKNVQQIVLQSLLTALKTAGGFLTLAELAVQFQSLHLPFSASVLYSFVEKFPKALGYEGGLAYLQSPCPRCRADHSPLDCPRNLGQIDAKHEREKKRTQVQFIYQYDDECNLVVPRRAPQANRPTVYEDRSQDNRPSRGRGRGRGGHEGHGQGGRGGRGGRGGHGGHGRTHNGYERPFDARRLEDDSTLEEQMALMLNSKPESNYDDDIFEDDFSVAVVPHRGRGGSSRARGRGRGKARSQHEQ